MRRWLVLILACAAIYGGVMIWQSSFTVGGERFFTLHDDMMISLNYARNLVAGNGCVWTPGQVPVQGYSNPGWVAVMTIPFLLGMSKAAAPLFVQLLGLSLVLLAAFLAGEIAGQISDSKTVRLIATALVAFYYPLLQYGILGFEVSALAAITIALVLTRKMWLAYLLLAVGVIIRLDFLVIAGIIVAWMFHVKRGNWKLALACAVGAALAVVSASYNYYGGAAFLTSKLKLTGFPFWLRISRGIVVWSESVWRHGLLFILLPFLAWRKARLVWWLMAGTAAYAIFVGGDAWQTNGWLDRWTCAVVPLWLALVAVGIANLEKRLRD